jgi:hypothetical protein
MADVSNLFGLQEDAEEVDEDRPKEDVATRLARMKAEGRKDISGAPPHLMESLCTTLSRLALGRRLYSPENKLLGMMEERVEEAWKLVSARNEIVAVDIGEDCLMYQDHVVFQQPDRDTIAHRLYRDSVRRLIFSPECTMEELMLFLTIFDDSDVLWQQEADCADKLWILNLKGIKYQAVDGFDELVAETRGEAVGHYAAALDQFAGEVGALAGFGEDEGTARDLGGEFLGEMETRRVPIKADSLRELANDIKFGAARSKAGFWNAEYASPGKTFAQFLEMLEYVVTSPSNPLTEKQLEGLLGGMFREQLAVDDGEMVGRIEGAFAAAPPIGGLAEVAWQRVVNPDLFTELLAEEPEGSGRRRALSFLMEKYLRPSAGALVRSVVATKSLDAARPLLDMLLEIEGDDDELALWTPHLESLSAEFIEAIVERLPPARFNTPAGAEFSAVLWTFVDPARAILTMRSTPDESLPQRRDVLLSRLNDPLPEIRCEAAYCLGRLGDPSTGIYMLNCLRRISTTPLTDAEIRALLVGLLQIGGERYLSYVEQCLGPVAQKRRGLFGRRKIAGHRNPLGDYPCVHALAKLGSPPAKEMIRNVFDNTPDDGLKSYIGVLRQNPDALPGQTKVDERPVESAGQEGPVESDAVPDGALPEPAGDAEDGKLGGGLMSVE